MEHESGLCYDAMGTQWELFQYCIPESFLSYHCQPIEQSGKLFHGSHTIHKHIVHSHSVGTRHKTQTLEIQKQNMIIPEIDNND